MLSALSLCTEKTPILYQLPFKRYVQLHPPRSKSMATDIKHFIKIRTISYISIYAAQNIHNAMYECIMQKMSIKTDNIYRCIDSTRIYYALNSKLNLIYDNFCSIAPSAMETCSNKHIVSCVLESECIECIKKCQVCTVSWLMQRYELKYGDTAGNKFKSIFPTKSIYISISSITMTSWWAW